MKKTLLALAVMAAAGTANAGIEIYNDSGVTVDMKGDIEVVYLNGKEDGGDMKQEIQDADLGFDVRYAFSDKTSLGAYWEFTDSGHGSGPGDAYVAAYTEFGSFKVGRLCTALDDAGIGSDYQYGITSFFDNSDFFCGDETARYDFDSDMFYATIGLRQNETGSSELKAGTTYADTRFGVRVADFDFTGLFGQGENDSNNDETLWGAEARFNGIDKVGLAVAYYNMDNEVDTTDTIGLSATFQATETIGLAAGYSMASHDDSRLDADDWYVNAGYSVAPNSVIYAEIAGTTQDHQVVNNAVVAFEDQLAFAVGAKVEF